MKKQLLTVGAFFVFSLCVMADFNSDFADAKKLFNSSKYQEAKEAFEKLIPTAENQASKEECIAYVAKSIIFSDKLQYAQAIQEAKKITDKENSMMTQLFIMQASDKTKDVIAELKEIDTWPKSKEKFGALVFILNAYVREKDNDNIIKIAKEITAYTDFNSKSVYHYAVQSCALAQLAQNKFEDAIETLKLSNNGVNAYNKCRNLGILGDIYAAQGKKNEAIATYKEIIAMKGQAGVSDNMIVSFSEKITNLTIDKK